MYDQNITPKKSGGFWKKIFRNIGGGLLFGICAGIAFYGVNIAYEELPIEELQEYLAAYPAGTTVAITYERYGNGAYEEYECQVLLQNKSS